MNDEKEQKGLKFEKFTPKELEANGVPFFNNCNHYLVDMSHLRSSTEDYMNTIVVKLPNGNYATFCVMQISKDSSNIDTSFHGENIRQHRVLAFGGDNVDVDKPNNNRNIYALVADAKKVIE